MKKIIAVLAVVFTMATATACDFDMEKLLSSLNPDNSGNEVVLPDNGENENQGGSENQGGNENQGGSENEGGDENEENDNVVKPITGGGDFNAGNNYNQ